MCLTSAPIFFGSQISAPVVDRAGASFKLDRKNLHQAEGDEEDRHGIANERKRGNDVIQRRVLFNGRDGS